MIYFIFIINEYNECEKYYNYDNIEDAQYYYDFYTALGYRVEILECKGEIIND